MTPPTDTEALTARPDTPETRRRSSRPAWFPDDRQELLLRAALGEDPDTITELTDRWWAALGTDPMVEHRHQLHLVDSASERILPLLHHTLARLVPDHALVSTLRPMRRDTWQMQLRGLRDLDRFRTVLREAGAPATLLLKGLALASTAYPDRTARTMGDIDLAIPHASARSVITRLVESGWTPGFHGKGLDELILFRHATEMTHLDGTSFDLHWRLLIEGAADDDEELWGRSIEITLGNGPIRTLDPTGQLVHVLAHGARANDFPPIRWVADGAMILRSSGALIDVDLFCRQASRRGHTVSARTALSLLRDTFDVAVPAELLDGLAADARSTRQRLEGAVRCAPAHATIAPRVLAYGLDFTSQTFGPLGWRSVRWYPRFARNIAMASRLAVRVQDRRATSANSAPAWSPGLLRAAVADPSTASAAFERWSRASNFDALHPADFALLPAVNWNLQTIPGETDAHHLSARVAGVARYAQTGNIALAAALRSSLVELRSAGIDWSFTGHLAAAFHLATSPQWTLLDEVEISVAAPDAEQALTVLGIQDLWPSPATKMHIRDRAWVSPDVLVVGGGRKRVRVLWGPLWVHSDGTAKGSHQVVEPVHGTVLGIEGTFVSAPSTVVDLCRHSARSGDAAWVYPVSRLLSSGTAPWPLVVADAARRGRTSELVRALGLAADHGAPLADDVRQWLADGRRTARDGRSIAVRHPVLHELATRTTGAPASARIRLMASVARRSTRVWLHQAPPSSAALRLVHRGLRRTWLAADVLPTVVYRTWNGNRR